MKDTISTFHLFDTRLSYKAKGLLSFMLTCPDDKDFSIEKLTLLSRDGPDSVRTALKELVDTGYITRCTLRDERGIISGVAYTIYEQPQT